jgi:tRNA(adenine34) deaminase
MTFVFSDEYFMAKALQEARMAFDEGEVPVGAVVVSDGRIIAKGHNQTERLNDVTAHAEIVALTAAAGYLGSKYLKDCTLYVTLEPCTMCAGALAWAQLGRLVFGAVDKRRGFSRHTGILHPKTEISEGILNEECSQIIKDFFKVRRR